MWNRKGINNPAGTVVVQAAGVNAVRVQRMLLSSSVAASVDVQTTGGVSLSGGPMALAAGVPLVLGYPNLDNARNNSLFNTGFGPGLQLVIAGGTVTGYVDYSLDVGPAPPPSTGPVGNVLTVNSDGWSGALTVPGKPGGTFNFGTKAAPNMTLTVSSKSWTAAGVQTTLTRTLWVTAVKRQPYPNQALRNETASGGNVVVQAVFSDFLYAGDTVTAINVAAGFFTDNGPGGSGQPNTPFTPNPVNNSTLAYPKPIGMWLNHDRDRLSGSTSYAISMTGAHRHAQQGQTWRAVQFIATDQHSHTSSVFVSAMSKQTWTASGLSASVFAGTLDFTPLTQGDLCTIDAVIYPWIGDSFQVSVNGAPYPSPNLTTLQVLNDKTGAYGTAYAYVNGVGGGTPTVSTTPATAQANPYATVIAAAAAMQTFNNANFGRLNLSGGIIRIVSGTNAVLGNFNTASSVTGPIPVIIEADVPANKATCVLQDTGTNLFNGCPAYMKLRNLHLKITADCIFLDQNGTINSNTALICDSCTFDRNAIAIGNGYWIYQPGQMSLINCDATTDTLVGKSYSTTAAKMINMWGCGMLGGVGSAVFNAVGCKDLGANAASSYYMGGQYGAAGGPSVQAADRSLIGWCFLGTPGDGVNVISGNNNTGSSPLPPGEFAIIGSVLEMGGPGAGGAGGGTTPAFAAYNDNDTSTVVNYIDLGNTIVGSRNNALYQDVNSSGYTLKMGVASLTVSNGFYCKTDVFSTNGANIGNWSFRYRVGSFYHCAIAELNGTVPGPGGVNNWIGEILATGDQYGTIAAPLVTAWTSDKSFTGAGGGNGNYRPLSATTQLNQIPAGLTVFPFDLNGTAVPTNGTAYVGALQA